MRLLISIIVALFASVGIAILLRHDPGYVLISVNEWTIETSVAAMVAILLVSFIIVYFLIRYLGALRRVPRRVKEAGKRRRVKRSERLLQKGMKDLAEGRWAAAESELVRSAAHSETPALQYVGAARAAHSLGADWRRDKYLREAEQLPAKDALVVGLTKAELFLEDDLPDSAKSVLVRLHKIHPSHPKVADLLARTHKTLGEWDEVIELLPDLRKRKAADEAQLAMLEQEAYQGLLEKAASGNDATALRAAWKKVPRALRQDEALVITYAGLLRDCDAAGDAETLLRDAVNRKWSDQLVVGYGEIGRGDANAQLATAERWSKQQTENPYLLLTLGRLAKRARKIDKAREYLEQSIKISPMSDAYQELGEVYEELKDSEHANQSYRAGLRLLSGKQEAKEGETLAKGQTQQALPSAAGSREETPAAEAAATAKA